MSQPDDSRPDANQIRQWIAEALERGRRANIDRPEALADMAMRDLQARGVRLVWRPELPEQGGGERGGEHEAPPRAPCHGNRQWRSKLGG